MYSSDLGGCFDIRPAYTLLTGWGPAKFASALVPVEGKFVAQFVQIKGVRCHHLARAVFKFAPDDEDSK